MTPPPDIHALSGPYVLNAVDDSERAAFEQHLANCADCSAEVDDLRESVTRLSLYVARQPPATLKLQVTTAADRLRQLPPVSSLTRPRPAGARIVRRSLTLAAALLAIATSGAVALDQYRDNTAATAISTRAATILAQPDTLTIHGQVTGGGQATVVLSRQQDAAVVLVRNLPPLSGRKTYQLWLIDASGNAHSIGLTNGKSLLPTIVRNGMAGKTAFSVTIEPRGGSTHPTPPATGQHPIIQLNTKRGFTASS